MVIIEDLHWAAGPLVEVLERVLSDAAGPVLLLGTMRPDGAAFPAAETLTLERLADEEVAELAESALAGPLDSHALELVAGHADGNPFFAEEVLADLLDRGLLERSGDGWSLRDAAVDLGIPDTVRGVLAARIDLLPPEAKEALQAASVIGRSFTPGGLAALTGSSAAVRTLVERGFVRPTEPELVFKHALTREVAYAGLPKAGRARLHAAFARWIEADDATDRRAGVLAHHYSEAVALTSPSSPGATGRTSFGSSRRLRFAGCGGPPSSRWRASTSMTPSRSFTAPPSSRRTTPASGMRSAG